MGPNTDLWCPSCLDASSGPFPACGFLLRPASLLSSCTAAAVGGLQVGGLFHLHRETGRWAKEVGSPREGGRERLGAS